MFEFKLREWFEQLGDADKQTEGSAMLHITDGESVAGTLRESTVPGDVSIYGDLMYEGPAPAGLDAETWRETRARFVAVSAGWATLEDARSYMKQCDAALEAYRGREEVVLWLDHRLSDQLIHIKVLDWYSRQDLGGVKLSLISIGSHPDPKQFVGLGALEAKQLASLLGTRVPVGEAHYRCARAAWQAFTSQDPRDIERFVAADTSALPFIAAALQRHLAQFPSVDSGLSRTERQALSVRPQQGSLSGPRLFVAVQRMEEPVFMGDNSFYRIVASLAHARRPLVEISDSVQHNLGVVSITETGRNVLEGRADHIDLNGIDEWLGGVHLKGDKAAWRWDRASARIVGQL